MTEVNYCLIEFESVFEQHNEFWIDFFYIDIHELNGRPIVRIGPGETYLVMAATKTVNKKHLNQNLSLFTSIQYPSGSCK